MPVGRPSGERRSSPGREAGDGLLLVILGPTGTGKSEIAYRCARRFGGEIVGFDSIQVYRGLDAGTAKPPPERLREIPHHCLDIVGPGEDFSLGDFVRNAERAIADIQSRGCRPILAGGTGLYLRGILQGVLSLPPRDRAFRDRMKAMAERRGTGFLHRLLQRWDPASARRILPGDRQRMIRALEVFWKTGVPLAEHIEGRGGGTDRYPSVQVGLTRERPDLYAFLDRRVREFFDAGLVEELREVLRAGCPPDANALKAIGYREAMQCLEGRISREEAIRRAQQRTRNYAKRQWTWFRKMQGIRWFPVDAGWDAVWREMIPYLEEKLDPVRRFPRSVGRR